MSQNGEAETETTDTSRDGTEAVIEVDHVAHSIGAVDVLSDVTATVEAGTVTCLIGPNGAGKTTLLRLIAGLVDPDDGSITVAAGGDRAVGYLSQHADFRPQFTVRETLAFYDALVTSETDLDAVIERVGLQDVADRRVDALSGGMRRLLAVAQTSIGDPSALVLDEPASGLDPTMRRHIADTIQEIAADGVAVLLATHDLRAVDRVADEVLVLADGEILAATPPTALRAQTDAETLEDALASLAGDVVGVSAGLDGGADDA